MAQTLRAHRTSIRSDDDGQGLAEYALILALIAIVAVVALIFLGSQVSTILEHRRPLGLDAIAGRPGSRAAGRLRPAARSCPRAPGPRTSAAGPNLADFLAGAWISFRFLLMVLGLWYSRAALGGARVVPPVTPISSGRTNLKRSNRLVLLVGVFLAIVAFVGILVLVEDPEGSIDATRQPTTGPVVVAAVDIPLSTRIQADGRGRTSHGRPGPRCSPGASRTSSQVIGQIARQPVTRAPRSR